jgi:hypothetical protein
MVQASPPCGKAEISRLRPGITIATFEKWKEERYFVFVVIAVLVVIAVIVTLVFIVIITNVGMIVLRLVFVSITVATVYGFDPLRYLFGGSRIQLIQILVLYSIWYVPSGFCRRITDGNQSSKELDTHSLSHSELLGHDSVIQGNKFTRRELFRSRQHTHSTNTRSGTSDRNSIFVAQNSRDSSLGGNRSSRRSHINSSSLR